MGDRWCLPLFELYPLVACSLDVRGELPQAQVVQQGRPAGILGKGVEP